MTKEEFDYYLDIIQIYDSKVFLVALLGYIVYFSRRDSFVVIAGCALILEGFHFLFDSITWVEPQFWSPELREWYFTYFNEVTWAWIEYISWYCFYSFTDFLLVFVCYRICTKYRYNVTFAGHFILQSYLAMGFLQMMNFLERGIFRTDYTTAFYSYGISSVNTSLAIVITIYVIGAISMSAASKRAEG